MRWARSSAWECTAGDQSSSPNTTQVARCRFSPLAALRLMHTRSVLPVMKRSTALSFMAEVSRPVMNPGAKACSSFL